MEWSNTVNAWLLIGIAFMLMDKDRIERGIAEIAETDDRIDGNANGLRIMASIINVIFWPICMLVSLYRLMYLINKNNTKE